MLNKWLDRMPGTAQEPGESASMRTTLDQARKNAVTPMTHLFLRTGQTSREMTVKRHIDVKESYFTHPGRKETIIHQMDAYFRNSETGKLKESFAFVVNNGVDMPRRRVAQMTQWKVRQQNTTSSSSSSNKSSFLDRARARGKNMQKHLHRKHLHGFIFIKP